MSGSVTRAPRPGFLAGAMAALLWLLLGVRWFDPAASWRPGWLQAVPSLALALPFALALGAWLWLRRAALFGAGPGTAWGALLACTAVAFVARLYPALGGGAGYLTPDGALSGIVALRAFAGTQHLVFVPAVAYSGSLKSHLAAALMVAVDPARAFALASIIFYAAFVAAVFALARGASGEGDRWTPAAAALYVAFAPAFVTRYSLSNDGNYVEVLAFGTWALVGALRWRKAPEAAGPLALATGALLGLAFWCHVLALVHVLAVGAWMLVVAPRRALRAALPGALGFALGLWPSLLWNAAHGWETVRYLVPGGEGVDPGKMALLPRLGRLLSDHALVLLGYDPGYGPGVDRVLHALGLAAALATAAAVVAALRPPRRPEMMLVLALLGSNAALALFALPMIPGNPRYVLFSIAAVAVLLARFLSGPRARPALAALVLGGAAASLAQVPGAVRADRQWRGFVTDLRAAGVRYCHTDFYLAAKIDFLSGEDIVCSAKLGPTTTEYFEEYRARAEQAPDAALIAVNATAAEKLERRLQRLGIGYERRDLMKPVLLRFTRKVDPALLFPDREFPLRW